MFLIIHFGSLSFFLSDRTFTLNVSYTVALLVLSFALYRVWAGFLRLYPHWPMRFELQLSAATAEYNTDILNSGPEHSYD